MNQSNHRFCTSCGAESQSEGSFCTECGGSLRKINESQISGVSSRMSWLKEPITLKIFAWVIIVANAYFVLSFFGWLVSDPIACSQLLPSNQRWCEGSNSIIRTNGAAGALTSWLFFNALFIPIWFWVRGKRNK
jgi:predicted nucleic acid-binding Zn ribbon protein